ncbi:MAG: ABC transporter ATP-binding protein [Nitrospira sp.]|nr:ABC transporter ATP-binding protein [Nitrospira sp.]
MRDLAMKVEGLSKEYILGSRHITHDTLRDQLVGFANSLFARGAPAVAKRSFWALKDVSFEVRSGELIGIIGQNGAGKSTLLKVLSRITEPTEGLAYIYGRISSLLEVGTGFHPELSGRENIFLNAALLGMARSEINKKFDQIVEFSGIGDFIDTPVKRYSSGMYVRLAFAVAAHLEPDILIIDEVLAVGDASFQQKCLGKMKEVCSSGRTVLFVSHNMPMIEQLCERVLLLQGGQIVQQGDARSVIKYYASACSERATVSLDKRRDRKGSGQIMAPAIEILDEQGVAIQNVMSGHCAIIRLHYQSMADKIFKACMVSVSVHAADGRPFFLMSNELADAGVLDLSGKGYIDFVIPELPLSGGVYRLDTWIEGNRELQDWVETAAELTVIDGDFYGTGKLHYPGWEGTTVLVRHQLRHVRSKTA